MSISSIVSGLSAIPIGSTFLQVSFLGTAHHRYARVRRPREGVLDEFGVKRVEIDSIKKGAWKGRSRYKMLYVGDISP